MNEAAIRCDHAAKGTSENASREDAITSHPLITNRSPVAHAACGVSAARPRKMVTETPEENFHVATPFA